MAVQRQYKPQPQEVAQEGLVTKKQSENHHIYYVEVVESHSILFSSLEVARRSNMRIKTTMPLRTKRVATLPSIASFVNDDLS
jgi:hypothetical protein